MTPLVADLTEEDMRNLAAYYSAQAAKPSATAPSKNANDEQPKVGVASDNYFKPGKRSSSWSSSLSLTTLHRSDDNPSSATLVHRATGSARDVELCHD